MFPSSGQVPVGQSHGGADAKHSFAAGATLDRHLSGEQAPGWRAFSERWRAARPRYALDLAVAARWRTGMRRSAVRRKRPVAAARRRGAPCEEAACSESSDGGDGSDGRRCAVSQPFRLTSGSCEVSMVPLPFWSTQWSSSAAILVTLPARFAIAGSPWKLADVREGSGPAIADDFHGLGLHRGIPSAVNPS
jgi:hypothetical protein